MNGLGYRPGPGQFDCGAFFFSNALNSSDQKSIRFGYVMKQNEHPMINENKKETHRAIHNAQLTDEVFHLTASDQRNSTTAKTDTYGKSNLSKQSAQPSLSNRRKTSMVSLDLSVLIVANCWKARLLMPNSAPFARGSLRDVTQGARWAVHRSYHLISICQPFVNNHSFFPLTD